MFSRLKKNSLSKKMGARIARLKSHENLKSQTTINFHLPSSTTSLDTYLDLDGRKFHSDNLSTYILPSDSIEVKRTDLAHELYKLRWRGNFSSPVDDILRSIKGGRVLDCGCGSGKWLYEMAIDYPTSTFIGLDTVPLFSNINNNENKPLNLGFLEYNICSGLPFQDETFDFLFQRSMLISLNKSQWNGILNEFSRVLKPGGWLELVELQINEFNLTKTAKKFQKALNKYQEINDHYQYHNFPIYDLLRSTNKFHSIKLIPKKIAVGNWGGESGIKVADVVVEAYRGMKPTLKQIMDVTDSGYDDLLRKLSNEIKHPLNDFMHITVTKSIAMKI